MQQNRSNQGAIHMDGGLGGGPSAFHLDDAFIASHRLPIVSFPADMPEGSTFTGNVLIGVQDVPHPARVPALLRRRRFAPLWPLLAKLDAVRAFWRWLG